MLLIRSSDNSEAQHSSISIISSLQRDGHSCWNFSVDLLSIIWFGAFQIASAFLVICCSDFVFQERSLFYWPEGESAKQWWSWIMIRFAGCYWYHDGFFQTTAGVGSDQGQWIKFELFKVLLIGSADSVYFCAFVLFWLEIRLITIFPICFW